MVASQTSVSDSGASPGLSHGAPVPFLTTAGCRIHTRHGRGREPFARKWPLLGLLLLVFLAVFLFPSPAWSVRGVDRWQRVAHEGLKGVTPIPDGAEASSRNEPNAVAIYDGHVYVAAHDFVEGVGIPLIFRAPIRNNDIWEDISPPWRAPREVEEMVVFRGALYVGTSGGEIWRRTDHWQEIPNPAPPGEPRDSVYGMTELPTESGSQLCVAYKTSIPAPTITCSSFPLDPGSWMRLPSYLLEGDGWSLGSVAVGELDGELYVGTKREFVLPDGSTTGECYVRRFLRGEWFPVTNDCFGHAADQRRVLDMEKFGGWLYVGFEGHRSESAVLIRTKPHEFEDVTPHTLYSCAGLGVVCPSRYQTMAATSSHLYVGTRTLGDPDNGGDVLVRDAVDGSWQFSNEPGFGDFNQEISALASTDGYVYAAAVNDQGFQVWRRLPALAELFPFLERDLDRLRGVLRLPLADQCRIPPERPAPGALCRAPWPAACVAFVRDGRCPGRIRDLFEPFESIHLVIDTARHPDDDQALIKESQLLMAEAEQELHLAGEFAVLALKGGTDREARGLMVQAISHVHHAVATTHRAVRRLQKVALPG